MRNQPRPTILATIGTIGVLLLGACSSSPGPAATGNNSVSSSLPTAAVSPSHPTPSSNAAAGTQSALDACSLLTAAEIETATDYEVVGSNPEPNDGLSDCEWTLADNGGTIGLQVELDSPRAQQDHEFNCVVGFGMAPLEGVGDTACGDPIDGGGYRVYVLRADDQIALRMQADYHIDKSAWAAIAKAVVARLP